MTSEKGYFEPGMSMKPVHGWTCLKIIFSTAMTLEVGLFTYLRMFPILRHMTKNFGVRDKNLKCHLHLIT